MSTPQTTRPYCPSLLSVLARWLLRLLCVIAIAATVVTLAMTFILIRLENSKLFIAGHSKGGGMAPLAAWRFHNAEGITPKVVTFAGAHCGSSQFAAAYNAEIDHDRYEFGNDIVPWLPLSEQILESAFDE